MTHIRGKTESWDAVFSSFETINGELILYLDDETTRKMEDWGEDTLVTMNKLKLLLKGDKIIVITWGGRSTKEWFSDVDKIES